MSSIEYSPPKSLLAGKYKSFIALEPAGVDKYQDVSDHPDIRLATIGVCSTQQFMTEPLMKASASRFISIVVHMYLEGTDHWKGGGDLIF